MGNGVTVGRGRTSGRVSNCPSADGRSTTREQAHTAAASASGFDQDERAAMLHQSGDRYVLDQTDEIVSARLKPN